MRPIRRRLNGQITVGDSVFRDRLDLSNEVNGTSFLLFREKRIAEIVVFVHLGRFRHDFNDGFQVDNQ